MIRMPAWMARAWVLALATASLACSSGPVPLGSPMSQDFDASRSRRVSARGCGFMLFGFVPIVVNNRFQRIQSSLLKQTPGEYVTNVELMERWTYAYVGTVHCTTAEAIAYPRQ